MTKCLGACILLSSFAIPGLQVSVLTAQLSKQAAVAPIPAQIRAARKVFVANAGGDETSSEEPQFSGGPDRAYNQFYAAMKIWGKYELVGSPADADLLFEIRFTAPPVARPVLNGASSGGAEFDPQLRLVIRDPKSNATLWGFTQHVPSALLRGNHDKNFDLALAKLVADAQRLSAQSAADESKK
jgi:hypothetical protein